MTLRASLELLQEPAPDWVPETRAPDGGIARDVAIIGAGMAGLAVGLALIRNGVSRTLLVDRAPAGVEGPWDSFARMPTLRSPKQLAGPALGLPALTFRAWFEAREGRAAWDALGKIPRGLWMEYLRWYRAEAGLEIRNGAAVAAILPEGGLFRIELADGPPVFARHVVMATGRDGFGAPRIPENFLAAWRGSLFAHSADAIDFGRLAGKHVAVLGGGASAFDNAGAALEAGCASLALLLRRPALPRVNASKALDHRGAVHGWPSLDDAARWRLMLALERRQTPPPRESVLRVARHGHARLLTGAPVTAVAQDGERLVLATPRGAVTADFTILGTGFAQDATLRPELAAIAPGIRLWRDVYQPPPEEADAGLAASPYLDGDFACTGQGAHLARLHIFNFAATLSLGKLSGDIPAIGHGADRLARGICARLFAADVAAHAARLDAYQEPELLGDEWPDGNG
jgi:cation diffusion facilitator CzcD-associated flavoprotein CzcO